ncbi:succinyldiaminopimelate transaminase [Motilibacter peucedani]|uniref:Aminotransferase n=1 Tax=Motilibacter peucedani TaxID=598650 RepID=A0A420XMI2_9ACTN|nr:succinyldiaminopimelate transaminase [Motilibacter peucedani]RKS72424.1 succinyldiaminopimelate transaminase [Motilibacter peucedani]
MSGTRLPGPRGPSLPDFPWDRLAPYKAVAAEAGGPRGGLVDLSVGTPVDPVPAAVQAALAAASDSPGYPTTHGTPALREAAAGWFDRTLGVTVAPADVLPTVGSKELVAWLPTLLGVGAGDTVVVPAVAYPTYAVGALLAGAHTLATDSLTAIGPERVSMLWLNSPSNPTGRVLPVEHLRKVVDWARERGVVVVSDECYVELSWDPSRQPVSVLHPDVSGGSHEGLLAVHSLSKRSNLAGYRAGLVTGDPALVAGLLEVRKHAGMIVPAPVQAAMTVALADDEHVREQHARYAARRTTLLESLLGSGFTVEHSEAGLYLWASRDEPCWDTVRACAERGVLVTPGDFYGSAGARHVRVALTATDADVARAAAALAGL